MGANTKANQLQSSDYAERLDAKTIRIERLMPASVETVWSYIAESEKRGLWLSSGEMPQEAEREFTMSFNTNELTPDSEPPPEGFEDHCKHDSSHKMLEYNPPRLLRYQWFMGEIVTEVRIELSAEGEKTRLLLTHTALGSSDDALLVSAGWHAHLEVLLSKLKGEVPRPFWPHFAELKQEYENRTGE